jgi:hypothetical protein
VQELSRESQLWALLDGITTTVPVHLAAQTFVIFTEELVNINIDAQVQIHTDSIPILGTALGEEDFIGNFLREKLQRPDQLLRKLDKFRSNRAKYQVLKLSVSTKARHLLYLLPISRPAVADFCVHFDQSMQNFFARTFNLHNPTQDMIAQFTPSTFFLGMGTWL